MRGLRCSQPTLITGEISHAKKVLPQKFEVAPCDINKLALVQVISRFSHPN